MVHLSPTTRANFKTCVKRTWQIGVCCNQTGQHSTHCHPFYATGPKILASDSGWLDTQTSRQDGAPTYMLAVAEVPQGEEGSEVW